MINDIQKIDLIAKIKARLLEALPELAQIHADADVARERPEPEFYKQKYLAVLFEINDRLPAGRRSLRQLARALDLPPEENLEPAVVAEAPAPYRTAAAQVQAWKEGGLWKQRASIRADLRQFDDGADLAERLRRARHLREQLELIHARLPLLRGLKAYRFLERGGWPVVVPDHARRTFFFRLGLTRSVEKADVWPEEFFNACQSLAVLSGESPAALNLLCGYYSGALRKPERFSPICGRAPKCAVCVVRQYCDWYRYHGEERELPTRGHRIKDQPESQRPRERLARSGPHSLSEVELLAILIRTGSGKFSALDLAALLLERFGSLGRIDQASLNELYEVPGIGPAKAVELKAALELGKRLIAESSEGEALDDSYKIYMRLRGRLGADEQENFLILLLNAKNKLIREVAATRGTLESSLIDPRAAFKEAIRDSAAAVVFVHNHPSGEPEPSPEDLEITRRLVRAGALLGIRVLDHVIVARRNFYSFAAHGQL